MIVLHDLEDAVTWMSAKWGRERVPKVWFDPASHFEDFSGFSVGSLKEALHRFYRSGSNRPPFPNELWKLVSEVHLRRIERGVETPDRTCQGEHVWADPIPTDIDRHRSCVLCGELGAYVKCDHPYGANTRGICPYCLKETV